MKKRAPDQSPWMSPPDFGRSLRPGLGISLLVRDVAAEVKFLETVLGATASYADADFAALKLNGSDFMVHADHTYRDNPVSGLVKGIEGRGAGVELRVYGSDPDQCEVLARRGGWTVLAGSMDKPHGLRECVLLDDEGYCWVPGMALAPEK